MLQPIDDHLIVIEDVADETTKSGIIIPDAAREKPKRGVIAAVGTDEELQELFKEGDRIAFNKYAGAELNYEGTDYLVMIRSDVLCKFN